MKKLLSLLLSLLLPLSALCEAAGIAPVLELHQLALGYADGYYIRCGDIEILIDGGKPKPYSKDEEVLSILRDLGVDKLDIYFISHWHLDHCGNVNPILREFGTPETMVYSPSPEVPNRIATEKDPLQIAPLATGEHRQMKLGDVLTVGEMTITCIGPENGGRKGTTNPDSLNFVVQYGTRKMLFTGDYAASNMINTTYAALCSNVDVLKFPHHGGEPYFIGDRALRRVAPSYVLEPTLLNNYKVYMKLRGLGVGIPRENVISVVEGHTVILTDGGDYFEVRTRQNPADYAPRAN